MNWNLNWTSWYSLESSCHLLTPPETTLESSEISWKSPDISWYPLTPPEARETPLRPPATSLRLAETLLTRP